MAFRWLFGRRRSWYRCGLFDFDIVGLAVPTLARGPWFRCRRHLGRSAHGPRFQGGIDLDHLELQPADPDLVALAQCETAAFRSVHTQVDPRPVGQHKPFAGDFGDHLASRIIRMPDRENDRLFPTRPDRAVGRAIGADQEQSEGHVADYHDSRQGPRAVPAIPGTASRGMPDGLREHPAMPELPEVETVRAGLEGLLSGAAILRAEAHRSGLRQPFGDLSALSGPVGGVRRRAKYLLIDTTQATLLSHLGMTGSWRIADSPRTHDHLTLHLADGRRLVFNDPRRFGLAALLDGHGHHPVLADLGPEPLGPEWNGVVLHQALRGRQAAIKAMIMDQQVVVGVGNIYAQEALFRSAIRPQRPAGRLDRGTCDRLVVEIQKVLNEAIAAGGSTISDFVHAGGGTGLFQHRFQIYGRGGQPCTVCGGAIRKMTIAGRTTCWCPRCQR